MRCKQLLTTALAMSPIRFVAKTVALCCGIERLGGGSSR